jgi:ubiquinone biosynthesis protein UbiJ
MDNALTTEQLNEEIELDPTTEIEGDEIENDVIDIEDNDLSEVDDDEEDDESDEFNHTAELKTLIEEGNQEAALKRLGEMEKGMEKLLARDSTSKYAIQQAQAVDSAFRAAAQGDYEAQRQVRDLLIEYGIDIEALALADEYDDTPKQDRTVMELQEKISRLERERSDERWLERNSRLLQKAQSLTKIAYTPADLVAARPFLPKSGQITTEQLVQAIHQGNPALLKQLIQPRTQRQLGNSAKLGSTGGATRSVKGGDITKMSSAEWADWARQHLKGNR